MSVLRQVTNDENVRGPCLQRTHLLTFELRSQAASEQLIYKQLAVNKLLGAL